MVFGVVFPLKNFFLSQKGWKGKRVLKIIVLCQMRVRDTCGANLRHHFNCVDSDCESGIILCMGRRPGKKRKRRQIVVEENILSEGAALVKEMGVSFSRFCEFVLTRIVENLSFREELKEYVVNKRGHKKEDLEEK
jgi:hypothetical protein